MAGILRAHPTAALTRLASDEIERARRDARISQANNDRDATLQEETARLQKEQRRFEVEAAPSVLLFEGGECRESLRGYHSPDDIADACADVYGE